MDKKFKWYTLEYGPAAGIIPKNIKAVMQKHALRYRFNGELDPEMVNNAALALREQLKSRLAYDYKAQVTFNSDGGITVNLPMPSEGIQDDKMYVLTRQGLEVDDLDSEDAIKPSAIKKTIKNSLLDGVYVALTYSTAGIIDAMKIH